jgi:hypothetical protein
MKWTLTGSSHARLSVMLVFLTQQDHSRQGSLKIMMLNSENIFLLGVKVAIFIETVLVRKI